MSINLIELNGLFNVFGFLFGLVAVVVLYGIIKRTIDAVRQGFLFVLFAMIAFLAFEVLQIFEVFQIISQTIFANVFGVVFVLLLVAGLWKLRSLIQGLSDFGQAFVLTSENKHQDKLVSLLRGLKGVCYVTLKDPYKKTADFLDMYGIDSSSIQFIDASGEKCDAENCIEIKNNPDDIKTTLDRVLKEKDIRSVIIDDVADVKDVQKFELPKFVQDASSLIKTNEAQGFFIGKMENLDKETINDIGMLVDKVLGEEK